MQIFLVLHVKEQQNDTSTPNWKYMPKSKLSKIPDTDLLGCLCNVK